MITTQKIQNWGNSKGVRIPKKFIAGKAWAGVTQVNMSVVGNKIVLTPATAVEQLPTVRLTDLLKGITPDQVQGEFDWGEDVGRERYE